MCGDGHAQEGDAGVPVDCAHLPARGPRARARLAEPGRAGRSRARRGAQGATNVLLEGVYHSVSRAAAGEPPSARPWYGSAAVVDAWARFLL